MQSSPHVGVFLATGAFFSLFTFVVPLLIHWVCRKYVTELVYNSDKGSYTAYTYSLLLRKKKVRSCSIHPMRSLVSISAS